MARFRFKFAAVLRQREAVEREAQAVLAAAQRERSACEDRILSLQAILTEQRRQTRDMLTRGPVSSVDLRLQAAASLGVIRRIEGESVTLSGAVARQERARERLAAAAVRRRAMEILRDRALDAWKRDEARREAARADDIISAMIHAREAHA